MACTWITMAFLLLTHDLYKFNVSHGRMDATAHQQSRFEKFWMCQPIIMLCKGLSRMAAVHLLST